MLSFWIYYGVLMVLWFGFAVYWIFPVIDKYLESLTDGDLKNYLCNKFRNPFLSKFGLMDIVNHNGYPDQRGEWRYLFHEDNLTHNNKWSSIFVFWLTFFGMVLGALFTIVSLHEGAEDNLHTETVKIATFLSQEATLPIVIIAGALLLHTTFKKLYKFGKKVKPLVDEINKEK